MAQGFSAEIWDSRHRDSVSTHVAPRPRCEPEGGPRKPRRRPREAFPAQHFPACLAGAGRPLLHSLIDYSGVSELAAARGSIVSGPISRSAIAFNFCI
jgi:hypothetical protein